MSAGCVVHLPHASTHVPEDVRRRLLLGDAALELELLRMTDWYTDVLFAGLGEAVAFPVSRLVVDPERFEDDALEPMAQRGMGVIYERTSQGERLRDAPSPEEREALLERFYRPHHARLTAAVERQLQDKGACLVLDAHSFPREALPYEPNPSARRPEICLGADEFHTPEGLLENAEAAFAAAGFEVGVNEPFAGALVPSKHYRIDPRVKALMVEVRRDLYMDERTGERIDGFADVLRRLSTAVREIVSRDPGDYPVSGG